MAICTASLQKRLMVFQEKIQGTALYCQIFLFRILTESRQAVQFGACILYRRMATSLKLVDLIDCNAHMCFCWTGLK